MINPKEVLNILQINGLDKNSPLELVNNILNRLNYSEVDKNTVLETLKLQGWFVDSSIEIKPVENINIQEPLEPVIKSSKKVLFITLLIIFVILFGAGITYSYIQKIGPFSSSKYTESSFLSSLLEKIGQINSSTYTLSGALNVVPRDKDASPFTIKEVSNANELKQKYFSDTERLGNVTSIISRLNSLSNYSSYSLSKGVVPKLYPDNIKNLFSNVYSGGFGSYSIVDPVTNKEYEYRKTENGNNFILTVDFETDYAIKAIKGYGYKATSTIITGKKVSFTKDSSSYLYMSSEPPKPFLVQMSDAMSMFPPDINISGAVSVSSEIKSEGMTDWLFNINAQGDFGDLTYKINADGLKKGDNYYFKINNIPSLFLFGDLSSVKGKWVNISSKLASSTDKNSYSSLASFNDRIPEMEKTYKENRERAIKFIKKVVAVADEEKLIIFKNKPRSEKIDGRPLVRYDLGLKKEAILPFYKKMQDEINNDQDFSDFKSFVDQGLVDYLQSQEFEQVFDYLDKNNLLVLWSDTKGFPAIIENTIRVVPPDTAVQLKDKQVNLTFKLIISDINKSLDIKAPIDFVSIEKIISDFDKNLEPARLKGESAALKSQLSSIRAASELAYDKESSYGRNPFPLGPCKKTPNTLFADSNIASMLDKSTKNNISSATCSSKGITGKVTSYAVSAPLPDAEGFSWCIDSTGSSKQILGVLKGDTCR